MMTQIKGVLYAGNVDRGGSGSLEDGHGTRRRLDEYGTCFGLSILGLNWPRVR